MTNVIDTAIDRRTALKLGLGGAATLLLPWPNVISAGSAYAQEEAQSGGTMVFIVQPEPPSLALYASTSGPLEQIATKVYEGLLEINKELQPIPGLASEYSISEDGRTATFKLRDGVK